MRHYYQDYQNAEQVQCRTKLAVNFTVGKVYQVVEVRTKLIQTGHADPRTGTQDEFCKFTDIYMINDNGELANAAEPTDFEIVNA